MHGSAVLHATIKSLQKLIKNEMNILDKDVFVVRVRAGTGGNGLARFNGVGGEGGHIYARPHSDMAFVDLRRKLPSSMDIRAANGFSSMKTKLVGDSAEQTTLEVPVGVEIVNESNGMLIARCEVPNRIYRIARGGKGASPENGFRAEKGEELMISIHLKLRPNVAFLGFPNAGKSTLLKAFVPKKSVKIAPYAFTTTKPQLAFWNEKQGDKDGKDGDSEYPPFVDQSPFTLSLADLPGVIEGASLNRGRGLSFLKHLEYADIICVVVDCMGFQLKNDLSEPLRTPLETIALLNREVEKFNPVLLHKPVLIVINKTDLIKENKDLMELLAALEERRWAESLREEDRPKMLFNVQRIASCSAVKGEIDSVRESLINMKRFIHDRNIIN